jgi:hypothetical protein
MRPIRPSLFAAALAAACLSACTSGSGGKTTPTPTTTVDAADAGISGGPAGASPSGNGSAGTLIYLGRQQSGTTIRLYSWKPGQAQPTELGSFPSAAYGSGNVSPDGTRFSWVDDGGKLHVAGVDGKNAKVLPDTYDQLCNEPKWSGDGKRLLVSKPSSNGALGWVDADSGAFTKVADKTPGCHVRQTGDAKHYVYQDGGAGIWLSDDATLQHSTQVKVAGRLAVDYAAVSADGSRIAMILTTPDGTLGDVGRSLYANAIVDTAHGTVMKLPVEGELRQAFFTPDGGMIIRYEAGGGTQVAVIDRNNRIVQKAAEPDLVNDAQLNRYAV